MRLIPVVLRVAAMLCFAGLQSAAMAAGIPGAVDGSKTESKILAASDKVAIAPHHAVYNMTLASVKNGSNVVDVGGKLEFDLGDACDGWTVQQHLNMHFSYSQGDDTEIVSNEASWESKDGKQYSFNVHHTNNGHDTDNYRGKVVMGLNGGKAIYTQPAGRTSIVAKDTLFPSAHTLLILQKALAGEKFFSRHVFDGTDEEGASEISVFIGTSAPHAEMVDASQQLQDSPLVNQPAWPVRMAFFKDKTTSGAPDYEMDMTLLSNGIIQKMRVDYGDFIVTGTLSEIKSLPASGC